MQAVIHKKNYCKVLFLKIYNVNIFKQLNLVFNKSHILDILIKKMILALIQTRCVSNFSL